MDTLSYWLVREHVQYLSRYDEKTDATVTSQVEVFYLMSTCTAVFISYG